MIEKLWRLEERFANYLHKFCAGTTGLITDETDEDATGAMGNGACGLKRLDVCSLAMLFAGQTEAAPRSQRARVCSGAGTTGSDICSPSTRRAEPFG